MKKIIPIVIVGTALIVSCSKPIISALEQRSDRVKLSQIRENGKRKEKRIVSVYSKETEKDLKEGYTSYDKDDKTGENIMSVSLNEVQVISSSKNIPERSGKICLDFKVEVPSALINNKWQVRLTPVADKNGKKMEFDKIFISGADFLKKQKHGYTMYQNFVNSIIPDSAYMQMLFDTKGYQKALNDVEEMFYMAWKKELLSQDRFIDWKNTRNKRMLLFNGIMERNRSTISSKSWKSSLPSYSLERKVSNIPSEWDMFLNANYSIQPRQMSIEDSIALSKKFFDYKKMAENERKKLQIKDKWNELVIFPKEECKLDTIIQKDDKFEYYYKQTIDADENIKKILLTVNGEVVALDESSYKLPKSDTITYYISSMLQFLDRAPRYKRIIVSRHATANTRALISFPVGSATYVDTPRNREEIDKVLGTIHKLTFTGELVLDSVNMIATSSPEGSSSLNKQLSQKRSYSLKNYLLKHLDDSEDIKLFKPLAVGEDWEGLIDLIKNDSVINKCEALNAIRNFDNLDQREGKLKSLPDYAYIKTNLLPQLRAVKFDFFLHRREMVKDTIHTTVLDTAYMDAIKLMENRQYAEALKTLTEYRDYNTALCLMSLGYDSEANIILSEQYQNSDVLYSRAIIWWRQKQERMALLAFQNACELDPSKFYRAALDPEMAELIRKYNLTASE